MTSPLDGLLGGLPVGIAATLAVEVVGDWASAVSAMPGVLFNEQARTATSSRIATLVAYGTLGGLALVAPVLYALDAGSIPPTPVETYGLAVAWGTVLLAVLALVYRFAFGPRSGRDVLVELLLTATSRIALGVWIRRTWIT